MSVLIKKTLEPFTKYFKVKDLIEVIINVPGEVWLETPQGWTHKKDDAFTLKALENMATILATESGQKFDDNNPLLATHLPEYGYRIQVLGGSIVDTKIALSIRVGTARQFPLDSYMNEVDAEKLIEAVNNKKNILVVGGTGSGKTTFVNSLINAIDVSERVVSVEDTKELIIPQPNQTRIIKSKSGSDIGQVSYADIINAVVRIRPDRIIFGEIAIDSTMPYLRLLNTGHGGSMATLHADSEDKAIDALILNAILSGGLTGDREHVEKYVMNTLDLICFIKRTKDRKFIVTNKFIE